jgi:prolipoprotein diacylglyceryltransferase
MIIADHGPTASRWLRPRLRLLGRDRSTFRVCGTTGLLVGAGLVSWLAVQTGLSHGVNAGLLLTGVATFLILAMATKIVTGHESLIYYHHEVAILTACGLLLSVLGQPVLPYLDLTAIFLGTFLTFGRVGCLMVGCCHGQPHGWGVRYGEAHAREGFPASYVGARLFPVQALEALFVAALVAAAALLVLGGAPAGTALSWYVAGYAVARFGLERLRGDAGRPYWLGFSEAQWTSVILVWIVALAEWRGRMPFSWWHTAFAAGLVLAMVGVRLRRSRVADLVAHGHVAELAAILEAGDLTEGAITVRRTSQAVGLSIERLPRHRGSALLVALSRAGRPLTEMEAGAIARVIANLMPDACPHYRLLRGRHDVFHLVAHGPVASS